MAGRIPQHFIDDLIARADLVELIGSRVPLKKAGREYKACCPFHNEKTPSFSVIPEKQFYHCFGCGAHGTALGFLMNYDRLSFPDAIDELAQRLGMEVPREAGGDVVRGPGENLYELMAHVASQWAKNLPQDKRALEYINRRGLTTETLQQFSIGYAANSWSDVLQRFGNDDSKRAQLAEVGLVIVREPGSERAVERGVAGSDRYYDRFRDRIMFPIRDARGRSIAFGGRVLDQGEPKYLNSPETPLFSKGRELYGLYEARQSRAPLKQLLVVEGYMDVVRLHQAGITYAVATLGTATTPEHLKRAFKLVREIVFCFDGDRAGRAAAWRALNNALPEAREGRELRFLFLPDGQDPDSLVGAEGREAFERRLAEALPLSEYLVRELAAQTDLSHADGRGRFAAAAQPLVARIPDGVYHELLVDRLAEAIRLPADRLRELWKKSAGDDDSMRRNVADDSNARGSTARSAGRGNLIRQAVLALVHFPAAANKLDDARYVALERVQESGAAILRELLAQLRAAPCNNTGQLLERWRDRAEYERLSRLAMTDGLIPDLAAARLELSTALDRLIATADGKRLDELLARDALNPLSREEKQELQRLIKERPASHSAAPLR